MRRAGTSIILLIVALAAIAGTAVYAYGKGKSDGQSTAAADRSSFVRGTAVGGGGFAGQGGGGFGGGGQGGFGGAGSAAAGRGGQGGGTPGAGGQVAANSVTGKVTKADGATLTVQESGASGTTATVTTTDGTTVSTFAAGALSDLKMNDFVLVQGDTAGGTITAKTIYALSGFPGGGGGFTGGGGTTGGNGTTGSPVSRAPGGNTGGQGGQGGQGGNGRAGGAGGGFAGLPNGTLGRITKIDGATLTLQDLNGTTSTVMTDGSTSVRKQTTGKVSDIKVGDTIIVQGEKTGDTAYTARSIIDQGA